MPATPRRRGRPRASNRPAGADAVYARRRHRVGPKSARVDASSQGRDRRVRQDRRPVIRQQRILAHQYRHQRVQPLGHAGQALPGRAAEIRQRIRVPAKTYIIDNRRTSWETIAPLLDRVSQLRTSHMRDPVGPQTHFASECFIDEVASARRSTRSSSASATLPTGATPLSKRRPTSSAGDRGRRRGATRPGQRDGPRHRLFAARRHERRDRGRSRCRPLQRQGLGPQVRRRA